ncbi:hypothetical protein MUY35_06495 [Aliiroseovarius sp. S1339]|uniref:hypothetical protein n=1 Tax=Aliiroseovarius sp. S1339 TaxID=2936990 RepID=UPI0020BE571B|nr:hypothetical protein [Aliiroseovarius sp. S1339]MCK8463496.1 hypothetical protein [Aliiroseovarius sp. S1339]
MTLMNRKRLLRPRHLFLSCGLFILIYFGANYSWSHAAIAGAVNGEECPAHLVDKAEYSVANLLGEMTANPWVYCMDQPAASLSVQYGTTRFAPLLPSIIILGTLGQNPDVASHEYVHAEVAERTSALLRTYRIPTWFDEGLAMQVDTRAEFDTNALRRLVVEYRSTPLQLGSMSTPSEFFGHGEKSVLHYALSKCVVAGAISEWGINAVRDLLVDVRWRSAFPSDKFQPFVEICIT